MMLRFRQVRLNLVLSWFMPLVMVFMFRSELPGDGGPGQFVLWMATGLAAFLAVFWVAFFANLLGFTANGVRRLSMSAEKAHGACMPGKVLGALVVVGGLVFAQTAIVVALLAGRIPTVDRAMLWFDSGDKCYGDLEVLRSVNLEIGAGVQCLVGRNGAGKTTLMRLGLGLTEPNGGTVRMFGFDPRVHPEIMARVGILLEEDELCLAAWTR